MPVLVSQTFEIVTPESAENGEAAESGYKFKDVQYTFRELVRLMRDHCEPSQSPIDCDDSHTWFTSDSDTDYRTGTEETTSIHFSRNNAARNLKYWHKAARIANPANYRSMQPCR